MKADGKLGLNYLKGVMGDEINALLCAVGHNIRMILSKLPGSPGNLPQIIMSQAVKK